RKIVKVISTPKQSGPDPALPMDWPSFKLAGLSLMAEPWNKAANYAKLEHYAREAAARGAQVIVAPEGYLEGYVGNDNRTPDLTRERYLGVGEELDGPLLNRVSSLARELKVYLSVGFAEKRRGKMYNSSVIFAPDGRVVSHYSKNHTASDEPFNEKGSGFSVV